jgi:hypothetical protein
VSTVKKAEEATLQDMPSLNADDMQTKMSLEESERKHNFISVTTLG